MKWTWINLNRDLPSVIMYVFILFRVWNIEKFPHKQTCKLLWSFLRHVFIAQCCLWKLFSREASIHLQYMHQYINVKIGVKTLRKYDFLQKNNTRMFKNLFMFFFWGFIFHFIIRYRLNLSKNRGYCISLQAKDCKIICS